MVDLYLFMLATALVCRYAEGEGKEKKVKKKERTTHRLIN